MNRLLVLASVVFAFIAGALAFVAAQTWIGILAVVSGILAAASFVRMGDKK